MRGNRVSIVLRVLLQTWLHISSRLGPISSMAAVGELAEPSEWLLVTLNGTCRRQHTELSRLSHGLLGFTSPGPTLLWAVCTQPGTQLLVNVTLQPRQTLQLTHVLDRVRARNLTMWVGEDPFVVCCYRRRQYQLTERHVWPLRQTQPTQAVVYLGVAGTCGFLVLGSALLAVVHYCTQPRRSQPVLLASSVHYSDELLRRRQQPADCAGQFSEPEDSAEEDVLLDMLSQPPEPKDATAAARSHRNTDFY